MSEFTKHDSGKLEWDLLPWDALTEVLKVLHHGAYVKEYGANNWERCEEPRRYWNAGMRHSISYQQGERKDGESGYHPLAHAICCQLFQLALDLRKGNPKENKEQWYTWDDTTAKPGQSIEGFGCSTNIKLARRRAAGWGVVHKVVGDVGQNSFGDYVALEGAVLGERVGSKEESPAIHYALTEIMEEGDSALGYYCYATEGDANKVKNSTGFGHVREVIGPVFGGFAKAGAVFGKRVG